jgi:hypothetical protein
MPTPSETLHAIRGAAEVNGSALASIKSEIPAFLALVEAWLPTTTKGLVRDQLARLEASYGKAGIEAARLVQMTTQAIDQLGTGGDPDDMPPSVPWSTGELQIAFGVSAKPSAGKELGRYRVVENITWDALISGAESDIPATGEAMVTFWTDGVPIATFTWEAGDLEATVDVLVPDSVPGDVIIVTAPDPQDATLSGIAGTLVGRRRGT